MKRFMLYVAGTVAMAGVVSCASENDNPPVPREDITLSASSRAGINDFTRNSLDLFHVAREDFKDNNFVFSPLSASASLAMMANGANGETLTEITDFLAKESSINEINDLCAQLLPALRTVDTQCKVLIANSMWYDLKNEPNQEYAKTIQKCYGANIAALDLYDKDKALAAINDWTNKATEGYLTNTLDTLPPDPHFVFANSLYFKGKWRTAFSPSDVQLKFKKEDGSIIDVSSMYGEMFIKYRNLDNCTVAAIPYGNKAFEMMLFIPENGYSLSQISAWLTTENYSKLITDYDNNLFYDRLTNVKMPKFKINQQNHNFEPWLKKLGIRTAFDFEKADFKRMFDIRQCLQIFKQSASIEVDENGTLAAATSESSVGGDTMVINDNLVIDRPFIFLIREVSTGAILFIGQLSDPTAH